MQRIVDDVDHHVTRGMWVAKKVESQGRALGPFEHTIRTHANRAAVLVELRLHRGCVVLYYT